ncbi:MAG: glycosyltransferase family 2 protein [Clostridia bacterium]|nr:glycosyltransferase family 2 protein [Clostridia bacterium]
MPKVSVIVPVYNVEAYLNRCIDSILNQTFWDFELILVDDGSSDSCGAICDAYKKMDERVRVIHKRNAGVSAARNTGIDAANGQYIMFVDSDDYIDDDMLEDMLLYDGSDVILSGLRYVDCNGKLMHEHKLKKIEQLCLKDFIRDFYIEAETNFILASPCNKLFRKEVVELHTIRYKENISICEDGLFVVDFLRKCKIVSCVPKSYYNYVQYGTNTLMCKYNANAIDACEMSYLAKIDMLQRCGISNTAIYRTVEKGCYGLFVAFLVQIYTRSGACNNTKYKKTKEALKNPSFCALIQKNKEIDFQAILLKISVLTRNAFLIHIICSIRYNKCRKAENGVF